MDAETRAQVSLQHFKAISETLESANIELEPDDPTIHGIALLYGALELAWEVARLFDAGRHLAAMALLRSTFEYTFRGYWLLLAASPADIANFIERDEVTEIAKNGKRRPIALNNAMRRAVDALPSELGIGHEIPDCFDRSTPLYKMMCSYSHGGTSPVRLRLASDGESSRLTDKGADVVLGAVGYTARLASVLICHSAGKMEHALALSELGEPTEE